MRDRSPQPLAHMTYSTTRAMPASMWYMLWQWKNQRPGLSAKNSMSTFCFGPTATLSLSGAFGLIPLAGLRQHAEEVAVQVHRVVHHRRVGEAEANAVAKLNFERLRFAIGRVHFADSTALPSTRGTSSSARRGRSSNVLIGPSGSVVG